MSHPGHAQTMSANPGSPLDAAALYLRTLTAYAPPNTLLDVRYRTQAHEFARFFLAVHDPRAARTITRIGRRTDVYVGCAPRTCRRGRRQDIAPTPLLWADCDTPNAAAALARFQPTPTMIVTSGSGEHPHPNTHAYWLLTRALSPDQLEHANRRLAAALDADPKCADPARILRVPGTLNFKHNPPRPVRVLEHTGALYRPVEILTALPPLPAPAPHAHQSTYDHASAKDPLQTIAPTRYVSALTGRTPGRDGKIHCPFHPDRTPSLHVYPTPQQGWTCYGCTTPTGTPLGGDIYTLASLLWHTPTKGHDFHTLRHWLDALFGIDRA
jgi:hypothetical protein